MPGTQSHHSHFVTTHWTVVCEAARGGDTSAIEALGGLFSTYWKPLYRYVRRMGRAPADAEDLVQGFFAHLLEHDGLRSVDRERGRFRAFLLGALKHFMANEWQREHRLKRGGFASHLSIDWRTAESGVELVDDRTPDASYDREWAMALLDKVLNDLAHEERDHAFEQWKPFLSIDSAHIAYAAIADELGMSEGAVRVAVHRMRKRYRQRIREEIARTIVDDALVEDELRALFKALSG